MGVDAPRCPSCSAPLTGEDACPACGLPLTGPAAAALWRIDVELAGLERQRARLLADREIYLGALREARSRGEAVPQRPLPYDVPLPPGQAPGAAPEPPAPAGPRKDLAGRAAQNLMLALGGLLLAVAAIVFTVVTWGSMGIAGRAAILLGVTAVLAYVPYPLRRRGLTATSETLALLAIGLFLLDCYAARDLGLAGLELVEGQAYWAVVTALTAVLSGAYARVLGLAGAFAAAVVLFRFPLPLAAAAAGLDAAGVAAGFTLTAAADLLLLRGGALRAVTGREPGRATRAVATTAFVVSWFAGGVTALLSGPVTDTDIRIVAALLAATAATGALFAVIPPPVTPLTGPAPPGSAPPGTASPGTAPSGAATTGAATTGPPSAGTASAGTGVGASPSGVPATAEGRGRWAAGTRRAVAVGAGLAAIFAPVLAVEPWLRPGLDVLVAAGVVALALLVASFRLPSRLRFGARWASALVVLTGLLFGLPTMLLAVFGPLPAEGEVWRGAPGTAWETLPFMPEVPGSWEFHASALFAIGAIATLPAARATGWRGLRYAGAALAVLVPLPVPFAGQWPYAAALALELALVVALLAAAAWLRGGGAGWAVLGAYAISPAPILLALADRTATLVTLGVLAAASAACAALVRPGTSPEGDRPGEAVASLAPHERVRAVASAATVFALAGEAFAAARAVELSIPLAGLAVLGVAALTVPFGWVRGRWAAIVPAVEAAGAVTAAAAILLTSGDLDMLDLALAATGVLLLATALRPGRDRLWYAGGGFLLVAAWLRLWLEDIEVIEAYSLPFAVPALLIGLLRRRRRPELSSWAAYGTGLTGGLLPSMLVVLDDEGWVRPLLLGAASLVVAVAGARARQQAPALIGAAVLAVVVIRELAPQVAEMLEAVPRWVPIAIGGALLLAVGTTFERRMRDLARLRDTIARMS